MKRIRSTYHTLRVFKALNPKLRKAIIANCNQETLKSICDCALNVLGGNIPLSACSKRKLRTYKKSIRRVADKSVFLYQAKGYKSSRLIPSPTAVCFITHSRLAFIPLAFTKLNEMYLVSSELFQKYKLAATN